MKQGQKPGPGADSSAGASASSQFEATLEVAKLLKTTYGKRGFDHHGGEGVSHVIPQEGHRVIVVFDPALSREVLRSPNFDNPNFFQSGLDRLKERGQPVERVEQFFRDSPQFQSGPEHRESKRAFHQELEALTGWLESQRPRILAYFRKRAGSIQGELDFATRYLRVTTGLMIAHLTGIPLKRVYQALALRQNVFGLHFLPRRHVEANRSFALLLGEDSSTGQDEAAATRELVALGLMIMGLDPLLGSLCASLAEGRRRGLGGNAYRHCPTSYTSRSCTTSCQVGALECHEGDVLYLSLVPSKADRAACPHATPSRSLAFGVGLHVCSGKRLALVMLDLAEEVLAEQFPEGVPGRAAIPAPDGAFLAFR